MKPFPLEPVRGVLQKRTEDAATALRRHGERKRAAEIKLEDLQVYRAEYLEQKAAALSAGTTASRLRDFDGFIARLDQAIAAQVTDVQRLAATWEAARALWMEQRQREQAFDVLADRHADAQMRVESRQDQKQQDEFASRRNRGDTDPAA